MRCLLQSHNSSVQLLSLIHILNWALRNEKDAKARDLLACVLYDKGHFQRAVQLWHEARRIDLTSALYARNLAVALFSHLYKRNEALDLLVEAMELDPNNDQLKKESVSYTHLSPWQPCKISLAKRMRSR